MTKNKLSKRRKYAIAFIVVILVLMLSIFFASTSDNVKISFFGSFLSVIFFAAVMLVLAIVQFIPSVFKRRSKIIIVLMCLLACIWLLLSTVMITGVIPDYYKDMPSVLQSSYSSYEGELTNFYVIKARGTHTYFFLDNTKFTVIGEFKPGVLVKGEIYRVEYLPNIKKVIHLYRVNK